MKRRFALFTVLALTFLSTPSAHASTTVLLTEPTHRQIDGQFIDDALATSLGVTGRLGALVFNPPEGTTTWKIDPALIEEVEANAEKIERLTGKKPDIGIVDRGYRGRKVVNDTKIIIPNKLPASTNNYQKQKIRKQFRARAGIEPIIGHLKQDHRMSRNYLLDELGDIVNTLLAAAGFNLRKMLQRLKAEALNICAEFFRWLFNYKWNLQMAC